jgi:hypothetical protein
MICAISKWGSIDGKGKAAAIGGVVEGRCEESAGVCEESVVRHSGGEEIAAVAWRRRAEGHEAWRQVLVGEEEGGLGKVE